MSYTAIKINVVSNAQGHIMVRVKTHREKGRGRETARDRERKRERERQTDRQRQRETETERDRDTERETETDRQTDRDTERGGLDGKVGGVRGVVLFGFKLETNCFEYYSLSTHFSTECHFRTKVKRRGGGIYSSGSHKNQLF